MLDETPAAAGPAPTPAAVPPAEAAGERRYLTVMFCDLVDSTGIATDSDARLCAARFGGVKDTSKF